MTKTITPLPVRFWRHVDKRTPNECWLWTGNTSHSFGYGAIGTGGRKGKQVGAHRASWLIHFGPIPDDLCVLHKCDVPACVNPHHLFLGSKRDNIRDAIAKNRFRPGISRGEQHGRARLTEADVRSIRADRRTLAELAALYGVSAATIGMIRTRRNWAWLSD